MTQEPTIQLDNVYGFPKHKMERFTNIVDNYYLIKKKQGSRAASDYVHRIVPIQLRKQVVNMINARAKIT